MPHPDSASRRMVPLTIIVLAATLLAGCGMNPRHEPPGDPQSRNTLRQPGYLPERRFAALPVREIWTLGGIAVDTLLLAPDSREPLPLVLYLPGLGEGAEAGEVWRRAWAEAGYAVLSLQPAELGTAAWTKPPEESARTAEDRDRLRRAGLDREDRIREQYRAPALNRHLAIARQALAELRRRVAAGQAHNIDASRVVIAGYDIGAQTAAALAGEHVAGLAPTRDPAIAAAILLSPHVELGAGTGRERFAAMTQPFLTVTGTEDDDPNRLVSTPGLRRVPWQSAPAGDKYLLVLENGTHANLSGSPTPGGGAMEHGSRFGGDEGQRQDRGGGGGRGRFSFGNSGRGGGMDDDGPSANRGGRGAAGSGDTASVQSVTTAFLDAVVKNDPVADEWLRRDATRWLAGRASLWIR